MVKKLDSERGNIFLKILDRYIGIPIVFSLGILKRKRKRKEIPEKIKEIAMLKTAAIGDTVLLSAVIKDIKEKLPESKITFFVGSSNFEIAKVISEKYEDVEVVKIPIKNLPKAISTIRQKKFDLWLDFGSWPRFNAILSYFSYAKIKVGFRTKGQFRHYVYDKAVFHRDDIHEVYNYKNILKSVNIKGKNLPDLKRSIKAKEKKQILIHMFPGGSNSYLREWPEENWIELINKLTGKGYKVLLSGAKADEKKAFDIYKKLQNKEKVEVLAGKVSLKKLIDILQECFAVISVNTGVMHIASALRCNLIALHGPTSFIRWGPLNKKSISLTSKLECSPCLNLGFEKGCGENKCMKEITVEDVIKAVEYFEDNSYEFSHKNVVNYL